MRGSGQYFDTLRTEVDQVPEVDIRKIHIYQSVFGRQNMVIVESLKICVPLKQCS